MLRRKEVVITIYGLRLVFVVGIPGQGSGTGSFWGLDYVTKPDNVSMFSGLVIIAWGSHPFPFRTRSLSPIAPMILLHGGKVGRCRDYAGDKGNLISRFFFAREARL